MVSGGTVTGDLSSLKSNLQTYNSEIGSLSGGWQGASFDSIKSQAEQFCSEYLGVISGEMESFASACDLYKEYESNKNQLNSLRSSLSSATDENKSSIQGQIASCETKLSQLKTQIEGLLASASSTTLQATSTTGDGVSASGTSALGTPSWGTFQEATFKADNGLTIKYYIYKPSYNGTTDVSGLPVMLYMHGGGNNNSYSNVLARGLSKALNEKTVNPSGICIIPYIQNFSDKRTVPALKQLCDEVVRTNNADPDRVSVSGHSYGGITTYRLINDYPGYFSAAVPISGFQNVSDSFKTTKVWAFNGEYDNGKWTSNKGAKNAVAQINQMGGSATLYTYKGYGHAYVQDFTYEREFESPDGDTTTPLEWAFRQNRKNNTTKSA